jgi:hypothetical protein
LSVLPLAFANKGASEPSTSGIGPAVATALTSPAVALATISALTPHAAANVVIFDQALMTSSRGLVCLIRSA